MRKLQTMGFWKNMAARAAAWAGLPVIISRGGISGPMGREPDVDDNFAMKISTVWSCVRLLSDTLSTLPLHVKERDTNRRRVHYDHPVARLLDKPNPKMNGVSLRAAMMTAVLLRGNAYAVITERDRHEYPTRLDFVLPEYVTLWEGDDDIFYTILGNDFRIPSRDVVHIKGLSTNGLLGLSPIRQHARLLGLSLSSLEFADSFYRNGCRTTGVFKKPGTLSDEAWARLYKQLSEGYFGARNAGKPLLLEDGLDYSSITIPPEDAQFIATRLQSVDEIAAIYGVPPHMAGNQSHSTYSNNEQQNLELYNLTLAPWIAKIEAEFNDKLFLESEKRRLYVDIDAKGLLRADTAARTNFYRQLYYVGAMNANEIRACEDLDSYEGGEQYFRQTNMEPVKTDGNGQQK